MNVRRGLWFSVGILATGLAIVGIAVPLLPTTPFLLVAAYAFAQSSERWHQWLLQHSAFGPLIENWQTYGAISRRAKVLSLFSMLAILGITLALGAPHIVLVIQALVLSVVAVFILSRPLPPEQNESH